MKANFVYSDLNPCGGGERFTLVTMQAVLEMGIGIELTTLKEPNIAKLENAYGKELASVIRDIKKVNVLPMFDEQSISDNVKNGYDLIINTHGDIDPYYNKSFSKNNSIAYCHFSSAKFLIQSEDKEYLEKYLKVARDSPSFSIPTDSNAIKEDNNNQSNAVDFDRKRYLEWLKYAYDNMIKNSTVLTNSEYSRKSISEDYGMMGVDASIISPPVDVDTFRNSALFSPSSPSSSPGNHDSEREDVILVISRIDPSKRIENAVIIAKLLKEDNIGKGMVIVGSLDPYYYEYCLNIKKMVTDLNLENYVKFEIDASLDKLLSLMRKSKVYFHPKVGEHFGMSIVESMSAGLIPVVPDIGGQTEFVPSKFQYHTLEQAVKIIVSALDIPYSERALISNSVNKFSTPNYKKQFQSVIKKLLRGTQ